LHCEVSLVVVRGEATWKRVASFLCTKGMSGVGEEFRNPSVESKRIPKSELSDLNYIRRMRSGQVELGGFG
jgi:hypothetical protein